MRNILVREEGRSTTVYVRCADCGDLVARYELSGYYHHGKGMDSYLRSIGPRAAESGRNLLGEFRRVQSDSVAGYQRALLALDELHKEV
jgi:hypothetical protein